MALRIGGGKPKALPVEEPMPMEEAIAAEEPMPEEPMPEEMAGMPMEENMDMGGSGTVDPMQVQYKTGQERAAQACGNCKYYGPEGACSIVAGPIDPEGICNIYSPMEQEEEMPMEEPMPEEEVAAEPEAEMGSEEGY